MNDALKQERRYALTDLPTSYNGDRPHVVKLEEVGVETSNQPFGELPLTALAGTPNRSPQTRTFTFVHDEHGLTTTATLAGVRTITNTWKKPEGAPGLVLESTTTAPIGAPAATVIGETRTFRYGPKAFVKAIEMSGASATKTVNLLVVHAQKKEAVTLNDAIEAKLNVDRFGRASTTSSSGGTDDGGGSSAALQYLDDGPWHARGKPGIVDRAGIKTTFAYPTPNKIETADPERNVKTTTDLDAWLRPKKVVTTGPQLLLEGEVEYDANGRVKTNKRLLEGRTITESFAYDALGRLTSSKSDGVAIDGVDSIAETKIDYDYAARTTRRTLPSGAEVIEKVDGLVDV